MEQSLPMVESRDGQSHCPLTLEPRNLQSRLWNSVRPFWSFHTRNRTKYLGAQEKGVFGVFSLPRNVWSSASNCDFCRIYFDEILADRRSSIRLSIVCMSNLHCLAVGNGMLSPTAICLTPHVWQNTAQSSFGQRQSLQALAGRHILGIS